VTLEEALEAAIFADSEPVSATLARWKPFILKAQAHTENSDDATLHVTWAAMQAAYRAAVSQEAPSE